MMDCLHDFVGEEGDERILASGEVLIAGLCRDREAWGTGTPIRFISARLAPLPPRRFLISALPSARPFPKV